VNYRVLGWPPDGPRLRLDYRSFAYAGKFVTDGTGKAVVTDSTADSADPPAVETPPDREYVTPTDPVIAAIAFNEDRTDESVLWFRYVTVRADRRGEGLGGKLAAFLAETATERGFETARIAVNNPFSYQALSKAGFTYTGRDTGLAELVLERPTTAPADREPARYRAGLSRFRERDDLDPAELSFLDDHAESDPPELVALPDA
jgi:GNAT superfamily N-acetyltransferase